MFERIFATILRRALLPLPVLALVIGFLVALVGCGGGGGGTSVSSTGGGSGSGSVTASVTVDWPQRTRNISAPSSALSVRFLLQDSTGKQSNVSWAANRSSNLAAHSETYPSTTAVTPGQFVLSGTFYANASEAGTSVATFTLSVIVTQAGAITNLDGTPLGQVQLSAAVKFVLVAPNQTITTQSTTTQLVASALDVSANPVAVSPGSFVFAVVSGQSFLSVTPDGLATGKAAGTASVTATVDGVTSQPGTINVVSPTTAGISVVWPTRTRTVVGPSSALSVQFLLHDPTGVQADITWAGDRANNLGAHTETYQSTTTIFPGLFVLSGTFYSAAAEGGITVATFSVNVAVQQNGGVTNPDGTPLPAVQFTGVVKTVAITSGQTVPLGATNVQLLVGAFDANGNPLAISPGSFVFSVVSGGSYLSVTSDGLASGLLSGTPTVQATADGVTSQPASVVVTGPTSAGISVDWPLRSRNVSGPSSALSVQFLLHDPSGTRSDISWSGNRSSTMLTAHTEVYQSTSTSQPGTFVLSGSFYAGANEGGIVVASFSLNVAVQPGGTITNPDGTALGTVQFTGVVKSVVVASGQWVVIGSTTQLAVAALDANGNPLAISPGSFIFSLTSGSNLSVTPDGVATGLHAGTSVVQAVADGVTSPPATVTVSPPVLTFNLDSNDIVYDSARNLLYVSTTATSSLDPSEVVPIDLTLNQIGTPFSTGSVPTAMALSGDGTHLFVGNDAGVISRVSLTTHTVDSTINLYTVLPSTASQTITRLYTIPSRTDSFAVLTVSSSSSPRPNTLAVLDSGVPRLATASVGPQVDLNDTGTAAFGTDDLITPNPFTIANITSSGVTTFYLGEAGSLGAGTEVCWNSAGVLATSSLGLPVLSPTTGAILGTLPSLSGYPLAATVPGTSHVYIGYSNGASPQTLYIQCDDLSSFSTVGSPFSLGSPGGIVQRIIYTGPHRAAVRTSGVVLVATGLP